LAVVSRCSNIKYSRLFLEIVKNIDPAIIVSTKPVIRKVTDILLAIFILFTPGLLG